MWTKSKPDIDKLTCIVRAVRIFQRVGSLFRKLVCPQVLAVAIRDYGRALGRHARRLCLSLNVE